MSRDYTDGPDPHNRHAGEPLPPVPFSSPDNALSRIFLEQWITFPRFVLTGAWWRALRAAA